MEFGTIPELFIDLKKQIRDGTKTPQKTLQRPATPSHRFYGILQIFAIVQISACRVSPTYTSTPNFPLKVSYVNGSQSPAERDAISGGENSVLCPR